MSENSPITIYFIILFLILSMLISTVGNAEPYFAASTNHHNPSPSTKLLSDLFPTITGKLFSDRQSLALASTDYGNLIQQYPSAVLHPSSSSDIISLIRSSYNSSTPFTVAARGRSHSVRGQALAPGGVVVDMMAMRGRSGSHQISVSHDSNGRYYVDVGGEVLWIDILRETTTKHGLAPMTWTDYLYLTVGGTLSNAGISGQTFRHGPQINNVYEVDVVTGTGEFLTCSPSENSELFYAVLGGLGQFGIITRARIALEPAPNRVKWVRMLYSDFAAFTRDQEHLISITNQTNALNYLEGSVLLNNGPPENWRSSSYPPSHLSEIISLITENGIIYCLEVAKYYDDRSQDTIDKDLEVLIQGMGHIPGFRFKTDALYMEFLNRVRSKELQLQTEGFWDVPHPWMNLFIPKSRIFDFDNGVFRNIVLLRNITFGPLLVYPMNRNKWDERMSAVIPDEEVFYTVGFLHSSGFDDWKVFDEQNKAVIKFCEDEGIKIKQYLPNHKTKEEWINHFGPKWEIFQKRKARFDPKMILSPGQKIFN